MSASTFEELRNGNQRMHGVCRRCGRPSVAQFRMDLRKTTDKSDKSVIVSKSAGICEPCGVAIYQAAIDVLGTRP